MDANILIIEDSMTCANLFKKVLEAENCNVVLSYDGVNIFKLIDVYNIDIILLDLILPNVDGFDILQKLQKNKNTVDIPVVIISGATESKILKKALDCGAIDYIRKSSEAIEVIARVNSAVKLKRKIDLLREYAQKDPLTKLYNRQHFNIAIEKIIADKASYPRGIALIMIDCDLFKMFNDNYGHTMGDEVLAALGNVLSKSVKSTDIACRFGGEEFCIILPNTTVSLAYKVAERVRNNVCKIPFVCKGRRHTITISCGVGHSNCNDNKTVLDLLNESDAALYTAKNNGRNRTEVCASINDVPV